MVIPDETHVVESLEPVQGTFVIQEVANSCLFMLLGCVLCLMKTKTHFDLFPWLESSSRGEFGYLKFSWNDMVLNFYEPRELSDMEADELYLLRAFLMLQVLPYLQGLIKH